DDDGVEAVVLLILRHEAVPRQAGEELSGRAGREARDRAGREDARLDGDVGEVRADAGARVLSSNAAIGVRLAAVEHDHAERVAQAEAARRSGPDEVDELTTLTCGQGEEIREALPDAA